MKTEKTDNPNPPKPRGYRFWLSRFILLLGLPLLFYYGYCWGLWGRNSLLLQYLFQCGCPSASEEARYPESVDVLVPACKNHGSLLSPSGRLLYVAAEEESGIISTYLLNLETNEKIPFTLKDSDFLFLTDDLLFVTPHNEGDQYILDRTTGDQYPIQRFSSLRSKGYSNSLTDALYGAKYIFLLNDYGDTVIALSPDFPASSEYNFYFNGSYIPGDAPSSIRMEQFLKENNITYEGIPFRFQNEVMSSDEKLVARADGVYSVETGQQVVGRISSSAKDWAVVRGWTHDSSAVIYSHFLKPCVIRFGFFILDDSICFFKVPQPVLKLKVPEEYFLP